MKFYIASSWRNENGVQMLTQLLRQQGHEVVSWIENNYEEWHNHVTKKMSFEEWVNSDNADQSFKFDTDGATQCDVLIYYGPAGKDACCELGAAWATGVPIIGMWAKGEDLGLMRKMMKKWVGTYTELLKLTAMLVNPYSCYNNQKPARMDFSGDEAAYPERLRQWEEWEERKKEFLRNFFN